jgi:hypothetical protein
VNTHFVEVGEDDIDVRNKLKEVKPETWIYDLIIDSHGGDGGVPIPSEPITSTDDITIFMFLWKLYEEG